MNRIIQWIAFALVIFLAGLLPRSADSYQQVENQIVYEGEVLSLAWSPVGDYLAIQSPDGIRLLNRDFVEVAYLEATMSWSVVDGVNLDLFENPDPIHALAWSPDSNYLISGILNPIRVTVGLAIWDANTYELLDSGGIASSTDLNNIIWSDKYGIAITTSTATPEGEIHPIIIYQNMSEDEMTLVRTKSFANEIDPINSITWHPTEPIIAAANADRQIQTWDVETGRLIMTFEGHRQAVTDVLWSADGSTLYSASLDASIRVWDTATGEYLWGMQPHGSTIPNDLDWNSDFSIMAIGSEDGNLTLWSPEGNVLQSFEGHEDSIIDLDWSPDDRLIATASLDNTVRVWEVNLK